MKSVAARVVKLQALADQVFMESGLGDRAFTELRKQVVHEIQLLLQSLHALRAFTELRKQVVHDPELLSQAVDVAVAVSLRAARLSLRADIKAGVEANGRRFLFSDWPLMDGVTRLAKARGLQLLEDAERYEAMAMGNRRSSQFLRLIARHLSEDQQVHEVFAESDLVRLWEQSKRF